MALFWISFVLSVIGSHASGELSILYSPASITFSGNGKARESSLTEIFSASLGLSIETESDWNGLSIADPFSTPEAVVEVYIDGVSSLGNAAIMRRINFPLIVDDYYQPDRYGELRKRIKQRLTNSKSKLVNIRLSDTDVLTSFSEVFGDLSVSTGTKKTPLSTIVDNDVQFVAELEALKAITARMKAGAVGVDNAVDYYSLRFSSLHALADYHGPDSTQIKVAKQLLAEALVDLKSAFVKAYNGSVLVAVVTTEVAHNRRTIRSAFMKTRELHEDPRLKTEWNRVVLAEDEDTTPEDADKAGETTTAKQDETAKEDGSSDYAAIFNIIFWFAVAFVFSVVAIVYTLMDMDPGRDSIVYRMTTPRIKKE